RRGAARVRRCRRSCRPRRRCPAGGAVRCARRASPPGGAACGADAAAWARPENAARACRCTGSRGGPPRAVGMAITGRAALRDCNAGRGRSHFRVTSPEAVFAESLPFIAQPFELGARTGVDRWPVAGGRLARWARARSVPWAPLGAVGAVGAVGVGYPPTLVGMTTRATPFPPARPRPGRGAPVVGTVTRGTTNPNRLRRMDRWIAATHGAELRRADEPVAVDLGYGAAPWTAVELLHRLRGVAPRTRVTGIESEPARVAAARPYAREGLDFRHGGFELPVPGTPVLVRAANVLRQYDEAQVAEVWRRLCGRLAPADPATGSRGGLLVEGTCDEIGRR